MRGLTARGVDVVIVGPVPEQRFAVAPAMARNFLWQQPLQGELTRQDFGQRQRHVLPLLAAVEKRAGVRVLYPDRYLCSGDTCRYARDGLPLYFDNNHLNPQGLADIAPLIAEIFARP
jgi:hypothetical protein